MSNAGRDWLFIDATQTVIEEEEEKKSKEREKEKWHTEHSYTHIYIYIFSLIFSRVINLENVASFDIHVDARVDVKIIYIYIFIL